MLTLLHAVSAFAPPAAVCNMAPTDPQYAAYTKNATAAIPGPAIVNLDLDPEQRWTELVTPAAPQIKAMIDAFKAEGGAITEALFALLEKAFDGDAKKLLAAMPQPYAGEIAGIEAATNISALDLFVVNIMYEVSGACTSIVAQDASGHILHGRNLDFGQGKALTTTMRPTLRHLDFQRGGKTVFTSTTFLGYVGCLTCVKPGAFSVSVDTRIWAYSGGLPGELIEWLLGIDRSGHFLSFMTRDAMEADADYAAAAERFNTTVPPRASRRAKAPSSRAAPRNLSTTAPSPASSPPGGRTSSRPTTTGGMASRTTAATTASRAWSKQQGAAASTTPASSRCSLQSRRATPRRRTRRS
jgi:hypothetical protein